MSYRTAGERVLNGESSILGAMLIMGFGSFVLTMLLWWIPFVGVFIGPVAAGFVGGRRAGTAGRALLAAILPAIILCGLLFAASGLVALVAHSPVLGLIGGLVSTVVVVGMVAHSVVLITSAIVGGVSRQADF